MTLLPRDEQRLIGVHPLLAQCVRRARELQPFMVVEGVRTLAQQRVYFVRGSSKTMASKHLTGHAVDLCYWQDDGDRVVETQELLWDRARLVAGAMKQAAFELQLPITWGGDWKKFHDGPHFEIDPVKFPF